MQPQIPEAVTIPRNLDAEREDSLRLLAIRRRILAVAKHRFARAGYDGVSLTEIQRAADVLWEDLRVHFDGKEPILEAVLQEGWKNLGARLAEAAFSSPNARMAMLSLLALMANVLEEDEEWVRLVLFEGRRPDPDSGELRVSSGYRKFLYLCTELVERGQKDGSFRPEYHPRVVASILVGSIEGIMRDRLMAEQENGMTPYSGTYLMSAFDGLVSYLGR